MKREKRVIACLLAIIMMITAVPDMHLWADEGTTETGSEWLSFDYDTTDSAKTTVKITKSTELNNVQNLGIKYRIVSSNDISTTQDEIRNNGKDYTEQTAIEITEEVVKAVAILTYNVTTITPDTTSEIPNGYSIKLPYSWEVRYNSGNSKWEVYNNNNEKQGDDWKVVPNKNSIEVITPIYSSNRIINSVDLTGITQPVAGTELKSNVEIPNDAGYTVKNEKITWKKGNSDDEATREVAEYETTYTAKVVLEAKQGYQFKDGCTVGIDEDTSIENLNGKVSKKNKILTITWNIKTEKIIKAIGISGIKKPIVGEKLSRDVSVTTDGINHSELKWENGNGIVLPDNEIVQSSTKYIAKITLKLKDKYKFDKEKSKILIKLSDESDITEEVKNNISYENGNIIIKWEYTTESMITSITPPSDITVVNGTPLEVIKQKLPTTVTANADGNNKELHVTWNTVNTSYDQNVKTAQSFEITGTVDVDKDKYVIADGVNLSVTIRIIVSAVNDTTAPVITGIENGKTYCQSKTFTVFDENLKSVTINGIDQGKNGSYTLAAGASYTIIATDVLDHTTTVTIVINQGHAWDSGKITQNATDKKEGIYTYSCTHCDSKKQSIIPRKSITVEWGKKLKLNDLISDTTGFEKVTVSNASKYKKYFAVDSKKGIVKTTVTAKTKIKKSIPVKLVLNGKTYTVDVKIKIPAPKVTISKKDLGNSYRYTFKYNIKGATKIKVRCKEINANTLFDKYLSKSKSNKDSYVICAKNKMKKYKNKLTFTITAYYGKNISKTYKIRK